MQSYRDLLVWQKAMELVVAIYRVTQAFPKSEIWFIQPDAEGRWIYPIEHCRRTRAEADAGVSAPSGYR